MELQQLLGIGAGELLVPSVQAAEDSASSSRVINNESGKSLRIRPIGLLNVQAACVGKTAFEIFQGLVREGRTVKSVQRCVEYYFNKSLDSNYTKQLAVKTFNQCAELWRMRSGSGRVDLLVRAACDDGWAESDARINVRLLAKAKVVQLAS